MYRADVFRAGIILMSKLWHSAYFVCATSLTDTSDMLPALLFFGTVVMHSVFAFQMYACRTKSGYTPAMCSTVVLKDPRYWYLHAIHLWLVIGIVIVGVLGRAELRRRYHLTGVG